MLYHLFWSMVAKPLPSSIGAVVNFVYIFRYSVDSNVQRFYILAASFLHFVESLHAVDDLLMVCNPVRVTSGGMDKPSMLDDLLMACNPVRVPSGRRDG